MKLIRFTIITVFVTFYSAYSGFSDAKDKTAIRQQTCDTHNLRAVRHSYVSEAMSEQEMGTALDNLANEPYSTRKLNHTMQLIMKCRRCYVSEQGQAKFYGLLEEACKNYNKNDQREVTILRGLLNMSQQCRFLSESKKEDIKKLITEISDLHKDSLNGKLSSNIKDLHLIRAKDDFSRKAMSLHNIIRRSRFARNIDTITQSEVSSAIHDLYAERSKDDVSRLTRLKCVLNLAQNTPYLSTINQYEVKEIMLPQVSKDLEFAKLSAKYSTETGDIQTKTELIATETPKSAVNVLKFDDFRKSHKNGC